MHIYAYVRISYGNCSADVGAYEVALDRVVRAIPGVDATVVARNDVTSTDCRAAEEVI